MKKETYVFKWQFIFDITYKITSDKKIVNTKNGKVLIERLNNCSVGFWFGKKFIPKTKLNKYIEKIKL